MLLERLHAGELRESREMAASLLTFWSDAAAHHEPRVLFAQVLRVAVGLDAPKLAAALLLPFQLEAITPGLARDFAALVARYGEDWTRNLIDEWADPESRHSRADRRAVLTWLASLRSLCQAAHAAAADPADSPAARLLVEPGWRALELEIRERLGLLPPRQREPALVELAPAILGWLSGAATVVGDAHGKVPHRKSAPIER